MSKRREFLKATAAVMAAPMINLGRFAPFEWSQTQYSARCLDLMKRALVVDMLSPLTLNFPLQAK